MRGTLHDKLAQYTELSRLFRKQCKSNCGNLPKMFT